MHNLKIKQLKQLKHSGLFISVFAISVLSACNSDSKKEAVVKNTAPIASNAMVITQTEVVIEDMLSATDNDGDSLTYSLITEPSLGTVVINNNGSYIYTPNIEVTGTDSFSFGVDDHVNPQVNGTVNITIEALNVDFSEFTVSAFNQESNAIPLSVNGREFINAGEENNFDNLLSQ